MKSITKRIKPDLKARHAFFDKQVHMWVWKDSMSGKNEDKVIEIMKGWGYRLGEDYLRQYPIGDRYVADFAFPYERVVVEVDDPNHEQKDHKKNDYKRDRFMRWNGWVIIRIPDKKFFKNPSFYRYLIHEVVEERRKKYEKVSDAIYETE